MKRKAATSCLTLILALLPGGPGPLTADQDPALPPAPEANRYGVNDDYIASTSARAMLRMREAGVGWVHYVFYWCQTNPQDPDVVGDEAAYDWTEPDREIDHITAAGLNVFARIVFPPAWATGVSYANHLVPFFCYDPTQPYNVRDHPDCHDGTKIPSADDFARYVRAVITRYRDRVRYWGFGYESHSAVFWQGTQEQFAERILATGYRVAKQIDPGLVIVSPDDDLVESLDVVLSYEARFGRFSDVISFHLLRHAVPGGIAEVAAGLQDVLKRRGLGRPFWVTELGTLAPAGDPAMDSSQATWLGEQLSSARDMPWIDKLFLYRLKHAAVVDFGLLLDDDSPKPAYETLRAFLSTVSTPRFSYLAEGATLGFFDLDICLANPNSVTAPVKLTFLRDDGARVVHTLVLAARQRQTVRANQVEGLASSAFSTVVESTTGLPVFVERTMFWDRNTHYGGHTGTPVDRAEARWYFAEGSQGFFDTYLELANSGIQPSIAKVTFLREWEPPIEVWRMVMPNTRINVYAGDYEGLVDRSFSITVESDRPIFAERAMYFGTRRFWDGGHESAGVAAPATRWFHAEGATGSYFDAYICVGNPNSAPATVTFTYLLSTGQSITKLAVVPALRRLTVDLKAQDPRLADAAVSTTVTSDLPVVSERVMYWPAPFGRWAEAHNSFGLTETAEAWGLAEGRVGGPQAFETFLCIANPNSSATRVRTTFLRQDGSTVVKQYSLLPTSRFNVWVNTMVPELANESFGVVVETLDGQQIAVERAMYWNAGGEVWAGGTNATATRISR